LHSTARRLNSKEVAEYVPSIFNRHNYLILFNINKKILFIALHPMLYKQQIFKQLLANKQQLPGDSAVALEMMGIARPGVARA